jgi:hypothetical protein
MHAREARAIIQSLAARAMRMIVVMVVVIVAVIMVVAVAMFMIVMVVVVIMRVGMVMIAMRMGMRMAVRLIAFQSRRPASTNRAHYSTSNSLTRISSPLVICTL